MGQDPKNITENFQFHQTHLDKNKKNLSGIDKFYRETFNPMHLMNFSYFNMLIDDFIIWYVDEI
jgi:hypothetical protein